jgi:hypothetical protein
MTHHYKRHATTDLFGTMHVATCEAFLDTRRSYRATDALAFLKLTDLHVPSHLKVPVALHNLSVNKTHSIATWLAHRTRARWHQHFRPASSSRLKLLEGRLSPLTERRLPRSVFSSLDDLLTAFATEEHRKDDPKSFLWKNPADAIISRAKKGHSTLASVKSATHH